MHPALKQARLNKALFKLKEIPCLVNGFAGLLQAKPGGLKPFFVRNATRLHGPVLMQNVLFAEIYLLFYCKGLRGGR